MEISPNNTADRELILLSPQGLSIEDPAHVNALENAITKHISLSAIFRPCMLPQGPLSRDPAGTKEMKKAVINCPVGFRFRLKPVWVCLTLWIGENTDYKLNRKKAESFYFV